MTQPVKKAKCPKTTKNKKEVIVEGARCIDTPNIDLEGVLS